MKKMILAALFAASCTSVAAAQTNPDASSIKADAPNLGATGGNGGAFATGVRTMIGNHFARRFEFHVGSTCSRPRSLRLPNTPVAGA